jgi:hypothetical protein
LMIPKGLPQYGSLRQRLQTLTLIQTDQCASTPRWAGLALVGWSLLE